MSKPIPYFFMIADATAGDNTLVAEMEYLGFLTEDQLDSLVLAMITWAEANGLEVGGFPISRADLDKPHGVQPANPQNSYEFMQEGDIKP